MTFERLKNYNSIKLLKESLELECGLYVKGVDTTKVPVMSGKTSDSTADTATMLAEGEYYREVCREYRELTSYLLNIKDNEVKAIAFAYFVNCRSFEEIGKVLHYDRRTVSRKLIKYIAHNAR